MKDIATESESAPSKKHGHWAKEEHDRFLQGIQMYGKNWKKINEFVKTRTSNQIRSHAQKHFLKLEKENKGKTTSPQFTIENQLLQARMLGYQAYLNFMMEVQKLYTPFSTAVVKPVTIIVGDEPNQDEASGKL